MSDLAHIAEKYDTDKAVHTHYLRNYEHYFNDLRDAPVCLLELGIRGAVRSISGATTSRAA